MNINRKGMKPTHQHDCSSCHFVGAILQSGGEVIDAWVHPSESGLGSSVILRHSSEPSDYWSCPAKLVDAGSRQPAQLAGDPSTFVMDGLMALASWVLGEARADGVMPPSAGSPDLSGIQRFRPANVGMQQAKDGPYVRLADVQALLGIGRPA